MAGMYTLPSIYLIGHFWSLGVEEQFYAFYPWVVKLSKKLITSLISMFLLVVMIKIFAKILSYKTANPFWYSWADDTRFDAMAIGGLGAWVYKNRLQFVLQLIKSKLIQLIVAFIILLVFINMLKIPYTLSHMVVAMVTVLTIYYAHLFNKPYINLRNRQIDYLGKISFGIYVFHPLAIAFTGLLINGLAVSAIIKIPIFIVVVILFTIFLASLSYRYFEKYFLNLKFKYAVVKSKD